MNPTAIALAAREAITTAVVKQPEVKAMGGGLAAAETRTREMASWQPDVRPLDAILTFDKELIDARTTDVTRNDGFVHSARDLTMDSIVGGQYMLNARPNTAVLGAPDGWEEEFQLWVEARFNLMAESQHCWFDTARKKSFTDMVRLAVGGGVTTGEVLSVAEWVRQAARPFNTAVSLIDPSRLSNPNGISDTVNIQHGIVSGTFGEPLAYWIRNRRKYDPVPAPDQFLWTRVDAYLPWGRPQVLHIFSHVETEQTRGIAAMASVLKEMRMTKRYRDVELQNAIINAMYAAVIESELPPDAAFGALGGQNVSPGLEQYLSMLTSFSANAQNVKLDGAKVPHLFPGSKLHMQPAGQIGDNDFEIRLLRHLAAAFGLSYEEFSRDFSNTNYSSARAAMMISWRHMLSKKKLYADGFANFVYSLWLEEQIAAGNVPLWSGVDRSLFYQPMMREAFCCATWIGAARGQIDELKETEAAVARMDAGLTTLEDEAAKLGNDWRYVLKQQAREDKERARLGLPPRVQVANTPGKPTVSPVVGHPSDPQPAAAA